MGVHVYCKEKTRSHALKGVGGVLFGAALVFYGQTLIILVGGNFRPSKVLIAGAKLVLSVCSLIFGLYVLNGQKDEAFPFAVTLILYCMLGIAICGALHNQRQCTRLYDGTQG